MSELAIARAVGRLDHTTAGDSIAIVDRWLAEDLEVYHLVAGVCVQLGIQSPPPPMAKAG